MIRALMTAASGMKAQQMQVDTIANNIANVNTSGFKRNEVAFRTLLYQTMREPGSPTGADQMSPTGLQVGTGTEISGSFQNFTQGALEQTGSELDIAVQGEGFFRVLQGNGEFRYTRDGRFRIDGTGQVVTPDGYQLDPQITIPAEAIATIIGEDGTVSVMTREDELPAEIGQITLYRFPNAAGLKAQGNNFYSETASSGAARQSQPAENGTGVLRQGYRERSNVAIVEELVALIEAQRNYEVNSRAIQVSDDMMQQLNQIVR